MTHPHVSILSEAITGPVGLDNDCIISYKHWEMLREVASGKSVHCVIHLHCINKSWIQCTFIAQYLNAVTVHT